MFAIGCKQANNGGGQKPDAPIESNEIIITVKGDDGVIVSKLNTIKVKKSLNLTWKDIKQKAIEKITTKENKEIKEWRLKDAKGEVLKDTDTFKKDETVWCVSKNKEKPPTNPITITIEADEGYTFREAIKPCTIEVQKGSAWSSIKAKAEAKIELKDGYEKTGWKLGGKDGGYLEDSAVFNENALIFATSKKKGEPDKPKVTITVKGDEGVEVGSPNNFSADSGSKWASIKTQAEEKAKAKAHFELLEWHLSESTGTLITDETEFKENATVFAVSKEKPKAKYKVEHHQQNLLNEEYTKKETEEKEGFAGEETEAEAKPYPGFTAHTFKQKEIKANGKTLVRILYKRNIVSLIIDLKGGETTTELQDGTGGKKLLTGKFEGEVSIKTPTKQGVQFEGWEPELPTNFPANDETVYTAKWGAKTAYRVTIEGDERVKVAEPQYMDVPIGSNKKIEDIKAEIIAKASLASGWLSEDYTFYDWRIGGEKGEEMQDATQITEDITVYARTNYKRFKLWGTTLEGYEGGKPRGRIFIPKTVKIIENEVFKECDGLKAVDLSGCSELIEIAGSAFSGCSSLESIDLSPCVKLTKIGKNAFKGCSKLKSVNLASCSELTEIGGDSWDNGAFNGCTSLESIDLSPCVKLTKIGKNAFKGCSKLKSVNLSSCSELTEIEGDNWGNGAFNGCTSLESIDLSPCVKLTKIGGGAFSGCSKLKSVDLSGCSELIEIAGSAFSGCSSLESIDLSPCVKLTKIGKNAFKGCSKLKSVNLARCSELTEIEGDDWGNGAFNGCTSLENIDLSLCSKLTKIGNVAFSGCSKLKSVDLSGCSELIEIAGSAFYKCSSLESIDLSPCVKLTKIGGGAFSDCSKLKSVDLSGCSEITWIGDYAFHECTSLESIDLSPCTKLKNITTKVFSVCSKLKSVDLSGCTELTNIWDDAFEVCSSLESIDLSPCVKLTKIGKNTFKGCSKLKSVDLSGCSEITEIGAYAFYECTSLESIDLSPCTKLTKIGKNTFKGCSKLKSVNLASCIELTEIEGDDWGNGAFNGCTSLENIDLSLCVKLTKIGYGAFLECSKLKSVDLSGCSELIEIERSVFSKCSSLESIDLSPCVKLTKIGCQAFSGCTNAVIKLPASITKVELRAFGEKEVEGRPFGEKEVEGRAFGEKNETYCQKVLVPNEEIKRLVRASDYPENRIEMY